MTSVQFRRSAQVVLDGSGYGEVRIAPVGKNWVLQGMTVNVSSTTNESVAVVCSDVVGDMYIVDSTRTGSSGDTSDTSHRVNDGHCLFVVWSGGDPGATATVVYYGDEIS